MAQTEEFTHYQPLGGSDDAQTAIGVSGLAAATPALTPLMIDAVKNVLVAWDGAHAGTAVGVLALNAPVGTTRITYYKSGTFRTENVLWPQGISDILKQNAFTGTGISVI